MKQFMIWPILVPAIAFFHDESLTASATAPQSAQIILCNDDSLVWDESSTRPEFEGSLQKSDEGAVRVDGTITEEGGTDMYNDGCYDMNNE